MPSPLEMLQSLLPADAASGQEPYLTALLEHAAQQILNLTRRTTIPAALTSLQVRLALVAFNRRGSEGELERKEGDVSLVFADLPSWAIAECANYRLGSVPYTYAPP